MTQEATQLDVELVADGKPLILYDRMRLAVEQCAQVDEAKKIRDQAAALAHYAKQRNDPELDRWMSEIRLRAVAQIGKISRELEKAERQRDEHGHLLPADGKQVSKAGQLKAAGISTSTANRYEELAAPEEQLAPAFESAMENYFATAAVENTEPTFGGIVKAVRKSLKEAGVLPKKRKQSKPPARDTSWVAFSIGLDNLGAEREWNWELICARLSLSDVPVAQRAISVLRILIIKLEEKYSQ